MATQVRDLDSRPGYRLNNTPTRWQKALRRALAEGVSVRQLATSGVWIATSGTDATTAYVVTPSDCECRAGQEGDVVCKHRAALRHTLGTLVLDPDPEPAPPAAPVALPVRRRTAVVEVIAGGRVLYRSNDPQPIRPAA